MIVTWSETYLRTSLSGAFTTIRSSPPTISAYLVEPTPVVERNVPVSTPPITQPLNIVNRTTHEREATTVPNLPDVRIDWAFPLDFLCLYLGLDSHCCSRCEYST